MPAPAADGESALRILDSLRPDLILLDVEMPVMDGLSTLKHIKARARPIPVIMCSALTQRGAQVTIEALANGAADYVAKPSGHATREAAMEALAHDLIPKILALTAVGRRTAPVLSSQPRGADCFPISDYSADRAPQRPSAPILPLVSRSLLPAAKTAPAIVLIGVSTGGPAAL